MRTPFANASSSLRLRLVVVLAISRRLLSSVSATGSYANVTLSNGNDLSVVVFLPQGLKPTERAFYFASRFEHGSMIGLISRKEVLAGGGTGTVTTKAGSGGTTSTSTTHRLFESDMWRVPHNSNWPESGLGLASEFGVGDDGAFCYYRCGWNLANDVTNGVLGYREAKIGEPFLKIGVGKLLKGTCPICDSTEDYRFNSPYLFAEPPVWLISQMSEQSITLTHEATLENAGGMWGYRLVKDISLVENLLTVTSTLTNLGREAFTTVWYSHNFFTCDGLAVGPGYEIDVDIQGGDTRPNVYEEPGTWSWSTPLEEYAQIVRKPDKVEIDLYRALTPGIRIKTEFTNDGATEGGYTIRACDTELKGRLERSDPVQTSMYAYNLYLERATLSPEPQILLHLEPLQTTSWTQRLAIRGLEHSHSTNNNNNKAAEALLETDASLLASPSPSSSWSLQKLSSHLPLPLPLLAIVSATCCWITVHLWRRRKEGGSLLSLRHHRQSYSLIPDHYPLSQEES